MSLIDTEAALERGCVVFGTIHDHSFSGPQKVKLALGDLVESVERHEGNKAWTYAMVGAVGLRFYQWTVRIHWDPELNPRILERVRWDAKAEFTKQRYRADALVPRKAS